jgi:hypothetical protein
MSGALLAITVLANGVATGIMLSTVVGIVPFMLTMPYEHYVQTVTFLWPRYDPMMPALNVLTVLLDAALAATAHGTTARLAAAAGILLVVVITISLAKNVPINKYVSALDAGSCPVDWAERDPRIRWRNWNLLRTLLAAAALVVNVSAAAVPR